MDQSQSIDEETRAALQQARDEELRGEVVTLEQARINARAIIGAFSSPEDVALMGDVMELIREDKARQIASDLASKDAD